MNKEIAQLLRYIAAAYVIKNEAKFRFQIIAYQRAADAIEHSTIELRDLLREGKLTSIPGVGSSLASHIEELLETGKVKHFEWATQGVPETVFPLLDVPTFGPKKAYKLVKEFNLKNPQTVIDDLEKIAKQDKIASLAGFGEKSQGDILRAIGEYREGKGKTTRMPLPYAAELAERVVAYLKRCNAVLDPQPLGSLRRMVATVGDIDIAVATNDPKAVIEHFVAYPNTLRVIEKGTVSASILVSSGRQIDLMVQPPDMFGALLQHFTGSKNHNIHLRELALKKGLSLSERGIKRRLASGKVKMETYNSEGSFYKALGMDWIPPEMREDTGEIELALRQTQGKLGGLPKLVELQDIKGDLHVHSSYPIEPSHDLGKSTMEEMLEKAKKLGYSYLAFTEHNPSISKHTKSQVYDIMAGREEKIEQLKLSNKNIRIINLLELDILPTGELAIDESALQYVDAVLVSIHSVFSMDKKRMTKRILKGFSHPKAKILSHPTGRLLNTRAGYELDFEEIFDFAKRNNKALEINAWPTRLDLPDSLVREAVKQGVRLVVDTDSHAVNQMDMMKYGVAVARRGWATKNDIMNTLVYDEFMKWLKS